MITFDVAAAYFFLGNLMFVVFGSAEVQPWIAPEAEDNVPSSSDEPQRRCMQRALPRGRSRTGCLRGSLVLKFSNPKEFAVSKRATLSFPIPDQNKTSSVDELNTYHNDDLYSLARIN